MRSILAIASLTLRDALRKRTLLVVGLFALVVIATTPFFGMGRIGAIQLVERVSLAAMTFLGLIPVIMLAATGIPIDLESKRIYSIVTKPVSRLQYLAGKVAGVAALAALVVGVMAVFAVVVIRLLALSPTLRITEREASVTHNGLVVATLSEGQVLAYLGQAEGGYEVTLPEGQGVVSARVRRDAVSLDPQDEIATVTADEAQVFHLGKPLTKLAKGQRVRLLEMAPDWCVVALPDSLQVWSGVVRREDASEPRGTPLAAERTIPPVKQLFSHQGTWRYDADTGRIHLEANWLIEGETWLYRDVVLEPAPKGDKLRGWLHIKGLFGHWPLWGAKDLQLASLLLKLTNPTSGKTEVVSARAEKVRDELVAELEFPADLLAGGGLNITVTQTEPPTALNMAVLISRENRSVRWRFDGLSGRPLPEKVRMRLFFMVRYRGLPSNLESAPIPVKVTNPADGSQQTHDVLLQNEIPLTFEFDRKLISPEGRVEIAIDEVPADFKLQIQPGKPPAYLLAMPRPFEFSFAKAALLIYLQLLLATLCATMWSTLVSGYVAALAAAAFYVWGTGVEFAQGVLKSGELLGGNLSSAHAAAQNPFLVRHVFETVQTALVSVFVKVFPNLSRFSGTRYIVDSFDVPADLVMHCVAITLVYGIVFFVLGWAFLRWREFK
jgi:hypothetical protein